MGKLEQKGYVCYILGMSNISFKGDLSLSGNDSMTVSLFTLLGTTGGLTCGALRCGFLTTSL